MFEKVAFTFYAVTDLAKARSFYEETLGLEVGPVYGDGQGVGRVRPAWRRLAISNMTPAPEPSVRHDHHLRPRRKRSDSASAQEEVSRRSAQRMARLKYSSIGIGFLARGDRYTGVTQ